MYATKWYCYQLFCSIVVCFGSTLYTISHNNPLIAFGMFPHCTALFSSFLVKSKSLQNPACASLLANSNSLQRSSRADDSNFTHTPSIRKQNHKQHETKFGTKRESTGGEHSCSAALSVCRNTSFCLSRHTSRTLRDYVVGVENRENTGHQAA